jgi:hypothetical protein
MSQPLRAAGALTGQHALEVVVCLAEVVQGRRQLDDAT